VRPRNKMVQFRKMNRKAISPIIATVLIIAVTLIAAVAIGGFVFGLFGASSNTAQVQVVNAALIHNSNAGTTTLSVTCQASAQPATFGFIQLSNLGTANTQVTAVSITIGGVTTSASLTSCGGTSPVIAGNTLYLAFNNIPTSSSGQQYSGFVVTSNGAQVVFTGAFS
jgi:flagellin-like protein